MDEREREISVQWVWFDDGDIGYKTTTKKLTTYCTWTVKKNDDDLGLLNTIKRFPNNMEMKLGLDKCAKVTFKKDTKVNSKNIIQDTNREITDL